MALRASGQETVTSDPVPLANKSYMSLPGWVVYLSHREEHKHLGTRTEFATTMKCIEHCLTNKNPSTNYENHIRQSVKWVNNSTSLIGSLRRGNSTTGPG